MDDPSHKGIWEGIFWHLGRCFHQPHSTCQKKKKTVSKILTVAIYSAKTIGLSLIIHLNDCQKWNWTQPSSSVPPFLLSPLLSLLLSALLSPSSLFSPPPTSSPSSTQINFSLHSRPSFEQPALTGVDQDMLSSNLLLSTKVAWIHLSMTTGLCLWPLMHVSYAVNTPVQGSTGPEPTLTISFWVALVVAGVGGCFKRKKTWFFFIAGLAVIKN